MYQGQVPEPEGSDVSRSTIKQLDEASETSRTRLEHLDKESEIYVKQDSRPRVQSLETFGTLSS